MQRRVKQWRSFMAKELFYDGTEGTFAGLTGLLELVPVEAGPRCESFGSIFR